MAKRKLIIALIILTMIALFIPAVSAANVRLETATTMVSAYPLGRVNINSGNELDVRSVPHATNYTKLAALLKGSIVEIIETNGDFKKIRCGDKIIGWCTGRYIEPISAKTPIGRVKISATSSLELRSAPDPKNYNYLGSLYNNSLVEILKVTDKYLQVRVDEKIVAWVTRSYVHPEGTTAWPDSESTTGSSNNSGSSSSNTGGNSSSGNSGNGSSSGGVTGYPLGRVNINSGNELDVRSVPHATNYTKLAALLKGSIVEIIETNGDFKKIRCGDKIIGWCTGRYIEPISAETPIGRVKISATSSLELRSAPDPKNYNYMGSIYNNSLVEILKVTDKYLQVRVDEKIVSWVTASYVHPEESAAWPDSESTNGGSNSGNNSNTNEGTGSGSNSGNGSSNGGGNSSGSVNNITLARVNVGSNLIVRSAPSNNSKVYKPLGNLYDNTIVQVLEKKDGYTKVRVNEYLEGWCTNGYLDPVDPSSCPYPLGWVNVGSSLIVRSAPSNTAYTSLGNLYDGAIVEILEIYGDYVKVRWGKLIGWCTKYIDAEIDLSKDTLANTYSFGIVKVSGTNLNVRSGPSTSYSKITSLTNNTIVEVLETNGSWKKIRYNSVTGWVYDEYLKLGKWTYVSSATTDSSKTSSTNSRHNMALAASRLDGYVVKPGQKFSWVNIMGPCSKEKGYLIAGVIMDNEYTEGYGGGVCQTSTTINWAVKNAGISTNALKHAFPSSYAPREHEATVAYPYTDFNFVNTKGAPIKLVLTTSGSICTCEVYVFVIN